MGIELLTEEQYRELQKLGDFDTKTSSWIRTPSEVRASAVRSSAIGAMARCSCITTEGSRTTPPEGSAAQLDLNVAQHHAMSRTSDNLGISKRWLRRSTSMTSTESWSSLPTIVRWTCREVRTRGGHGTSGRVPFAPVQQTRFEMLPDVHYGDARHFATDTMGVSEWLVTGTLRSGETIAVRGCDHYEFRDGKVVRKDSYWKIVG